MKILHTSDWHLGRTLHSADLTPAFEQWCAHVIDLVRERSIDALLICGDVYDRGVPSVSTVELFHRTLEELASLTTVILTSGNHDSPGRLGFGASLMRENIHIRTDSRRCGEPVELRQEGKLKALVYPIPYLDPDVERRRLAFEESEKYLERSHEAVLAAALERVKDNIFSGTHRGQAVARICMAHAFITGGEPSDSERDLHIGGVDSAPSALFRLGSTESGPLDYVALGHLHSPQRVGIEGDPLIRYSGSPIAFSFSETRPKSSVLLHITGGNVETELIPTPSWRPIRTLEGKLEEILTHTEARDCFLRCLITDESRPPDLTARLRHVFPYVLEIQHRRETTATHSAPGHVVHTGVSAMKTLVRFMEEAGGRPLSAEEESELRRAWESVNKEEN